MKHAKFAIQILAALVAALGVFGQDIVTNNTTPVFFSTYFFTGQVLNNRIVVTSLNTAYSTSNNLIAGVSAPLQPVNGYALTNLTPGDYSMTIDGVLKSWVITVPLQTNAANAAQILKKGVSGLDVFLWTNALPGVTFNYFVPSAFYLMLEDPYANLILEDQYGTNTFLILEP